MLSEKSDEKQIVDCARQKDRVVTSRNRHGAPVPQGAISLCQQVAKQVIQNPQPPSAPPPSPGSTPNDPVHTSTLTGGNLNKPGKSSPLFMDPNASYGIVPDPEGIDDDLPDSSRRPPPSKNRYGFGPGSSNGSGGGPGGSAGGGSFGGAGFSGGGSGDFSGEEDSEYSDEEPDRDGGSIPASFAGGSDYPSSFAGGGYDNAYQMPIAGSSSDSLRDMDTDPLLNDGETKNSDTKDGKSLFELASQRIQLFCSDRSCTE